MCLCLCLSGFCVGPRYGDVVLGVEDFCDYGAWGLMMMMRKFLSPFLCGYIDSFAALGIERKGRLMSGTSFVGTGSELAYGWSVGLERQLGIGLF